MKEGAQDVIETSKLWGIWALKIKKHDPNT
jgi:hypothetical protein